MIFKVQRPLGSTESNPPWLAYNELRTVMIEIPASEVPGELRALMGHRSKVYVEAELVTEKGDRVLSIGKMVLPQPW